MHSIAVLVPCYNEERTVAEVVADFRAALPEAAIYVFDNNSTDRTVEVAREAGAIVRSETRQGKGHVVRRMFADIEAETYVLVDGDATYEAGAAPRLIEEMRSNGLDFVNGVRQSEGKTGYRPGHRLGNAVFTGLVKTFFGAEVQDILSGYKVLSRRFVKSFPALSGGFEIETELTVHALELGMPVGHVDTVYLDRPEGSSSKLSTFRDGWRILRVIARLIRDERPLPFFFWIGFILHLLAVAFAWPIFTEFFQTGLVPRLPTAVLSVALVLSGLLSFACGLILDTTTRGRREMKRLAYLAQKPPFSGDEPS